VTRVQEQQPVAQRRVRRDSARATGQKAVRRRQFVAILVIAVGVALAPAAFLGALRDNVDNFAAVKALPPQGAKPGLTAGPTGTYDAATKRYVLEWSSQIVGGPFNNFTGIWHLEGVFEPA
jgi:hypothetical protein